ncbi:MAG: phosphate ABC transporter substrate-binding protein PstS [Thermodesulfobacteriota bacterium]|nr:phosphate ABC transporter substrate-binding protein PstS [Thermodesulfobacteriota bacterium]
MFKLRILGMLTALVVYLGTLGISYANTTLNGAGASFPYPVYSAWAFKYHKVTGTKLNYQSIGSGGGVRQIVNRTVDFGASDAPLQSHELRKNKLLQFPAVIGGVVLVVNIPGIQSGELKLDGDSVCDIFMGEIQYWNDGKIKKLNPELKLPDKKITVVHRSDGSGTTAIFTDYLSGVCARWKEKVGTGKAVKWPVGIGGKGNEGVANYVKRVKYSIGYVEFAYAEQNKLSHTLLQNLAGTFVEPSFESFKAAADSGDFDPSEDFHLWLNNAPGPHAWPIAGATFILLAEEKAGSNKDVVQFFDWAFKKGDETAQKLIYIPLPQSLKEKIRDYWKTHGIY